MKRTLTRRHFTSMTAAAAVAAGITQPRRAATLLAQPPSPQVEGPGTAGPAARSAGPVSSAPADQWTRDTPELVAAALENLPPTPAGPFQASWDSIQQNYKDPDWFRDGKFGIMMHWGIYSVPAHASRVVCALHVWRQSDVMQWHTEHYGPPTKFGYKDFLPMYTAAKWDPDAWAQPRRAVTLRRVSYR